MSVEQRGAASSVQIHQVDLKLTDTFIAEIRDVLTMCGGCLQLHSLWTILTAAVGGELCDVFTMRSRRGPPRSKEMQVDQIGL